MSNKKKNYRSMYHNKPAIETDIPEITSISEVANPEDEITTINTPVDITEPAADAPIFGCVYECLRLNVREFPSRDADVLCTLDAGAEVEIDESASTEEFYKVCTAAGQEGYCVKNYILID